MVDLLFDRLGFGRFAFVELGRDLQVWSNPNQSNIRSAVQANSSNFSDYEEEEESLVNRSLAVLG